MLWHQPFILSDTCDCLYAAHLLEVLAYVLYILDIVYIYPESSFENAVVALYVQLLYVRVQLL